MSGATSAAIHNPASACTPSVVRLTSEHRDRLGRFTRAAEALKPKAIISAGSADVPEFPLPDIGRQNGRPYHLWFKIIDEVDVQQPGYPTVRYIQNVVCRYYDIRRADLISSRRTRNVVRPRQMAMHLCREMTLYSYPHISRSFGGRDHTVAMHAHTKISELALFETGIAFDLAHLTSQVMNHWGMQ
jgi:hypothetical protein